MKTKYLITGFATSLLLSLSIAGYPEPVVIQHEEGIEGANVRLQVSDRGVGSATVYPCEQCPSLYLKVTPKTRAFVNDEPVSISSLDNLHGKFVMVFYDKKSLVLNRIAVMED